MSILNLEFREFQRLKRTSQEKNQYFLFIFTIKPPPCPAKKEKMKKVKWEKEKKECMSLTLISGLPYVIPHLILVEI